MNAISIPAVAIVPHLQNAFNLLSCKRYSLCYNPMLDFSRISIDLVFGASFMSLVLIQVNTLTKPVLYLDNLFEIDKT